VARGFGDDRHSCPPVSSDATEPAVGTLQDPGFTRFTYDFFVPGNGPLRGPETQDSLPQPRRDNPPIFRRPRTSPSVAITG
jgi:hypothetical protein